MARFALLAALHLCAYLVLLEVQHAASANGIALYGFTLLLLFPALFLPPITALVFLAPFIFACDAALPTGPGRFSILLWLLFAALLWLRPRLRRHRFSAIAPTAAALQALAMALLSLLLAPGQTANAAYWLRCLQDLLLSAALTGLLAYPWTRLLHHTLSETGWVLPPSPAENTLS